jgi:fumarylacetoacetase
MDFTHNPAATSWVDSAADPEGDFPVQNLPYGVFVGSSGGRKRPCVGVAIGDRILDLGRCHTLGLLDALPAPVREACRDTALNGLMGLSPSRRAALRQRVFRLLSSGGRRVQESRLKARRALVRQADAEMLLPARIGDYTDFYASVHHATNVGSMFRPDNPLLPNYKYVPIGYHGRASSIVPDGTGVVRPAGQTKDPSAPVPVFGPSRMLDYELEVGCFVAGGNAPGSTISMQGAEEHLFGLCLLNDWSARDIQAWEYQPLGPFLAKNFATTVSPWVVTMEALAPFRVPPAPRPEGDPGPLPYLDGAGDRRAGGIDLTLEVHLSSAGMRRRGMPPVRLSRGTFRSMYWTFAQMLVHHASNGCNLRPGDLLGSGTVSGPEPGSRGSLLELTWRGRDPLRLPTGEERKFLEDGDEVVLRGRCRREGAAGIGFGPCSGVVLPSRGAARG